MIRNSSAHPIQKKITGETFHFNAIQQIRCTSAPSSPSPSPSPVIRGFTQGPGWLKKACEQRWDILGGAGDPTQKQFTIRSTLQGTNISHLGKRKIIFKMPFLGDMLVPWRVDYFSGPPSAVIRWLVRNLCLFWFTTVTGRGESIPTNIYQSGVFPSTV